MRKKKRILTLKIGLSCYEYHLYSFKGQGTEYIHVQEEENIQKKLLKKYNNKNTNTYLIYRTLYRTPLQTGNRLKSCKLTVPTHL
jgi:hypothetical protein